MPTAVTKSEDVDWMILKPEIFAAIMDHFSSGEPLLLDENALNAVSIMRRDICCFLLILSRIG